MATLTWQAPAGWTPTGYTVIRKTVGTTESVVLTPAPLTLLRYEDLSGFAAGTSYDYVVSALSADVKAYASAETRYVPPPARNVENLTATTQGTAVTLSWTGVPGATRYLIIGSSQAMAREVAGTETSVTYSELAPGTYTWRVGARYEPGPVETPAATWPSVTLGFLAPRTVTLSGPRITGGFPDIAPRSLTLPGLRITGASTVVAPPMITLPGLIATGGFVVLSPRTITLPGLSVSGLTSVP